MATAGAIAGPIVTLDMRRLYLRQRRLIGSTMHTPNDFAELARIASAGGVKPVVADVFPLTELHSAQARFQRKDFFGKLVVAPDGQGVHGQALYARPGARPRSCSLSTCQAHLLGHWALVARRAHWRFKG